MTRDEFIKLHGEEAWDKFIPSLKEGAAQCEGHNKLGTLCDALESNSNIVAHSRIMKVLKFLFGEIEVSGLIDAKETIEGFQRYR